MITFWPVNWVAVLIVMVFSMVLGFLWYGPIFGKLWLKLVEKKADEITAGAGLYIGSALLALIAAYGFAVILNSIGVDTIGGGILAALVVWIGVGASTGLNSALYHETSKGAWLLNASYELVIFIGAGILLTAWPTL